MSRRVFLISRNRIQVFDWDKKVLISFYEFHSDDHGKDDFEIYLKNVRPKLTHVLVELLDEDFQREKIPHVYGADKKRLIQRQLDRHYRDKEYTYAKVLGRDTEGRKDEELLLTCISNPEPVNEWLDLVKKYQVPVVGIWSLPLISADLIKKLDTKSDYTLLVSRQMRSTLRESFFKNKKLLLSRQVTLDAHIQDEHTAKAYLSDGVAQMHKYFSNQRIIPFGKALDVFCVMPADLIEQAKKDFRDSDVLKHYFFSLESIIADYGIISEKKKDAEVIYAYLCSLKEFGSDHYSAKSKKNALYSYLLDRTIFYGSTVGSLMLLLAATFLYIASLEIRQKIQMTDASRQRLVDIYLENYHHLEHKISATDLIMETVNYSERLYREAAVSPENVLIPFGSIFGDPKFARISLTSLVWQKMHGNTLDALRRDVWIKTTPKLIEGEEYPQNDAEMDDKIPVVVITGDMLWDDLPYRETVAIMEDFVRRLQNLPDVQKLMVVKTPVDIRVDSQFTDNGGTDMSLKIVSDEARLFEIVLLFKPSEPDEEEAVEVGGLGNRIPADDLIHTPHSGEALIQFPRSARATQGGKFHGS